jgi:leucyl-tRNA synthetase
VFSRQRYWGEPFPVFYKNSLPYIFDDESIVTLPIIDKYLPTKDGEPPLARAKKEDWSVYDGDSMDTNVMPGWAGSSWYFLRFMDPNNKEEFVAKAKSDYWGQVDLYIGGAEHAVGHLLYSRFWTKFLYDKNLISFDEPFKKLINQGMILGRSNFVYRINNTNTFVTYGLKANYETTALHVDINMVNNDILDLDKFKKWRKEFSNAKFILENNIYECGFEIEKMSKSKYNTQTPDELIDKFGADTLRIYEMFLGPLEQFKPWSTKGINGVHNFLKKFWRYIHDDDNLISLSEDLASKESFKTIHKTIKKVEEDIERYSFNTVVSNLMICLNELIEQKCKDKKIFTQFIILLSPYAPHISEEIWRHLGYDYSITKAKFPNFDSSYLVEKEINYPISFNGKMRFKLQFSAEETRENIEKIVLSNSKTIHYLEGNPIKKVIIVAKKIINIVF